jgi:Protein of unknown function (DUF3489)
MPTLSIEASQNLESAAPKKGKTKPSAPSRRKPPSGAANPKKAPPQPVGSKATRIGAARTPEQGEDQTRERITKQERMLTLLSQPAGASIQEMMQATNWQQHSVRGFLAGTVKRKLGFSLNSEKRPKDHRGPLVRPAFLRFEKGRPFRRERGGRRCASLTVRRPARFFAAHSTPANRPTMGSSRSSTRSTPSAKPARPMS